MGKKMRFWLWVGVLSLLLPSSLALAGPKGQGQAVVTDQGAVQVVQPVKTPPGWSQGKKKGWEKKGAVTPPGLQKKGKIPPGQLKKTF
jgi:hypothetical protein